MCLPRGLDIIKAQGQWYDAHGNLPTPIRVTADVVQRDQDTAAALVAGMGLPAGTVAVDSAPYGPNFTEASGCTEIQDMKKAQLIKAYMKANPWPKGYDDTLAKFQKVLGKGVAPELHAIPCVANETDGDLDGGCSVASGFAQTLMMQWGGGVSPIGWGRVSVPGDVQEFLTLHALQRIRARAVPGIAYVDGASITWMTAAALADTGFGGTQFFVGHDTQMWQLAATLGLDWSPPGWPNKATIAGSGLRFDVADSSEVGAGDPLVTASYVHVDTFSDTTGALVSTPVTFTMAPTGPGPVPLSYLHAQVQKGIDTSCANREWKY